MMLRKFTVFTFWSLFPRPSIEFVYTRFRDGNGHDLVPGCGNDKNAHFTISKLSPHIKFHYTILKQAENNSDNDKDDERKPYGSRSLSWTRRYSKLIPYEKARQSVLSLGLQSKEEWDDYILNGKEFHGAYIPNRPDEMYADEWISWDEFLGSMRSYEQTKDIVQNVLKLNGRMEYELFVRRNPKRAEGLRIPLLPWKYYNDKGWENDDDFFGN